MDKNAHEEPRSQGGEPGAEDGPRPGAARPTERLSRREMLDQLQAMASQIAADAPPALREATAKAAELAAEAARSAGPLAQRIAEATDGASLKFADRSERFAADLRSGAEPEAADELPGTPAVPDEPTEAPPDESEPDAAPDR